MLPLFTVCPMFSVRVPVESVRVVSCESASICSDVSDQTALANSLDTRAQPRRTFEEVEIKSHLSSPARFVSVYHACANLCVSTLPFVSGDVTTSSFPFRFFPGIALGQWHHPVNTPRFLCFKLHYGVNFCLRFALLLRCTCLQCLLMLTLTIRNAYLNFVVTLPVKMARARPANRYFPVQQNDVRPAPWDQLYFSAEA